MIVHGALQHYPLPQCSKALISPHSGAASARCFLGRFLPKLGGPSGRHFFGPIATKRAEGGRKEAVLTWGKRTKNLLFIRRS
jgi:hypothetical protein